MRQHWRSRALEWFKLVASKGPEDGSALGKSAAVRSSSVNVALLSKSHRFETLSLLCQALTAQRPSLQARGALLSFFHQNTGPAAGSRALDPALVSFIDAHTLLFSGSHSSAPAKSFLDRLSECIDRNRGHWRISGAYVACCNIVAVLRYSTGTSLLYTASKTEGATTSSSQHPSLPGKLNNNPQLVHNGLRPARRQSWAPMPIFASHA